MIQTEKIESFLAQYDEQVFTNALKLRAIILAGLPDITEQLDLPAKMIAYCYGQKYSELICVIIPSKKGLKLGFNRGVELQDPDKLLKGSGKVSRYLEFKAGEVISIADIKLFLKDALKLYKNTLSASR